MFADVGWEVKGCVCCGNDEGVLCRGGGRKEVCVDGDDDSDDDVR